MPASDSDNSKDAPVPYKKPSKVTNKVTNKKTVKKSTAKATSVSSKKDQATGASQNQKKVSQQTSSVKTTAAQKTSSKSAVNKAGKKSVTKSSSVKNSPHKKIVSIDKDIDKGEANKGKQTSSFSQKKTQNKTQKKKPAQLRQEHNASTSSGMHSGMSSGMSVGSQEREELIELNARLQETLKKDEAQIAKEKNAEKKNAEKIEKTKEKDTQEKTTEKKFSFANSSKENDPNAYLADLRKKQGYMSAVDHLEELRWRIIRSLGWTFLFSVLAFLFYKPIWNIIMGPILPLMERAGERGIIVKMITTKLSDYVILQFKIAFLVGFTLAIPAVFMELWGFVLPALKKMKKFWGNILALFSIILFWSGVVLGRIYLWPMLTEFMIYDWTPPAMLLDQQLINPEVHLILGDYLSFFFAFHFAFGITFQLPVITFFLALIGVLKASFYFASWREAIVVMAVSSAIVTPPDIASMSIMMLPLVILYIVSGLLVLIVEKVKKRREEKMTKN